MATRDKVIFHNEGEHGIIIAQIIFTDRVDPHRDQRIVETMVQTLKDGWHHNEVGYKRK